MSTETAFHLVIVKKLDVRPKFSKEISILRFPEPEKKVLKKSVCKYVVDVVWAQDYRKSYCTDFVKTFTKLVI